MECRVCRSTSGEQRISPGPTIYSGQYWMLEHCYPIPLRGWLVIVLKRHAEALHELSEAEFRELADIQAKATQALFAELACEKEYVACFAEKEGFHHLHFHLIPRLKGLPAELRGTNVSALGRVDESEAVPADEIRAFCEAMRVRFSRTT